MRQRTATTSWFGCPVPSPARLASRAELEALVSGAQRVGFSRTAKGLDPDDSDEYVLISHLPEPSPVPSIICRVIRVPAGFTIASPERPDLRFALLDVPLQDFKRLRRMRRREYDQLVHWLAWLAARSKRREVR
jgi:hypothetical protein